MTGGRWTSPTRLRGWAPRLFATRVEEPRSRRATDGAVLIGGLVGLFLLSLLAVPPAGFESDLIRIIAAFPAGLTGLWRATIGLLGLFALVVVVASLVRRRWALLRDIILGSLLTLALGLVVGGIVQGAWSMSWAGPSPDLSGDWVPWLSLALPASAALVAKPHLTRPVRVLGWWLLGVSTGAAALIGLAPTLSVASLLVSVIAASTIHLALGSARGRPDIADVAAALAAFGVDTRSVGAAERQSAGTFLLEAVDVEGRRLDVKVYGRDAYDTQLLTTLWRTVWFRGPDSPTSPGRLQQVEHEAFLTLLAGQAGVLTQPVVTGGLTPGDDAILVLGQARGRPAVGGDPWNEGDVARLWAMMARLHDARIAHGRIDLEHLVFDGAEIGLIDFRGASVSHDPWHRRIDRAQALVTTILAVGVEPAARLAEEAIGADGLADVLPFLQSDPLTPFQQRALRQADLDIDALREEVARSIEIEPPELQRLTRVTLGSVLKTVLPVLAFFALAGVIADLDLEVLAESMQDASWWFVAVGLVVSQVPRLFQAVSALGASPIAVPLGRLYVLQLAQAYIALTIPGAAARVAMNVRFFQRHGLPPGTSLAVGALDSFAGFLSQVVLLSVILLLTSATLELDLESSTTSGLLRLTLVIAAVALLVVLVVLAVPALRRRVFERVREIWVQAIGALRGLASPRRLGLLFGGNLANEALLAVGLGAFAMAMGYPIGLGELIFINVTVSLLAGIIPIPGGIGVVEGGLMLGLARAGMPEELAFAAAMLFRFATFYLPPLWGFFAFRWLERNKHL